MGQGQVGLWSAVFVAVAAFACGVVPASLEEGGLGVERAALTRACGTGSQCSGWVYPSVYGTKHLVYVSDKEADRIPDFGRVGWKGSALGLPSEQPGGHPETGPLCDGCELPPDTALLDAPADICTNSSYSGGYRIQSAINAAAEEVRNDPSNPHRLVHLARGQYSVKNRLFLPSGVVLAGSANGGTSTLPPTTLHVCGTDRSAAIHINAAAPNVSPLEPCDDEECQGSVGAAQKILAGYDNSSVGPRYLAIPSGSNFVNLGPNHGLNVGNAVLVTREQTAAWISAIGMTSKWGSTPDLADQQYRRVVTRIEPRDEDPQTYRVFFDQPFTTAFETNYASEQTLTNSRWYTVHTVQKYTTAPLRARDVGVYNLRIMAHQQNCDDDECDGSKDGIRVGWAEDAWIQDVVLLDFWRYGILTDAGAHSRRITIENVRIPRWASPFAGGIRYSYNLGGELGLVANSEAVDGRHDFVLAGAAHGPNVFLDSTAMESNNHFASHHRWSNGALFDGVSVEPNGPGLGIANAQNTDDPTSLHGWTGANLVMWNTTADAFKYYNPPTAQNWLIGSQGTFAPPDTSQGEQNPHFDFSLQSEHGTSVNLHDASKGGSSLYRVAAYMDRQGTNLEHRTYVAGDPDDFTEQLVGSDPTWVNPAFSTWVSTWGAPRGLDYGASGIKTIPLTFRYALAPNETVVHAYLTFRAFRASASSNDAVTVAGPDTGPAGYADDGHTYPVSSLSTDLSGPSVPPGSSFLPSGSVTVVRVIDLYPLIDPSSWAPFVAPMNRRLSGTDLRGELNVNFKERIRVDWVTLNIVTTRP
jgi:hypothetical protein